MTPERMQQYLVERIRPGEDYASLLLFPSYFEIETVHACNARCVMCPGMSQDRPRGPMDPKLFTRLVQQIAARRDHVKRVSLFRDGEPLLDPQLEDRVREIKDAGVGCVATTSNMSLMTEERAEGLLGTGLDMIDMSIDGLGKETFETIRRGLCFETVRDNALAFVRLRDKLAPGCTVRVRMALQDANRSEWPAFERYWRSMLQATDTVLCHPVHNWGGNVNAPTPEEQAALQLPCVSLWSLCIVHVDGGVPLCTGKWQLVGNAGSQTVAEIWRSPGFAVLREKHISGQRKAVDACSECLAWAPSSHVKSIDKEYLE